MAIETIGLVAVSEGAAKKVVVKNGGKIKAHAGTKYLLQVDNETVAPENVTVKRVGNDLEVSFEGSDKPDLTIQGFFAEGMDSQLYGVSEDGQLYAYVRTDGEGFYGHLVMADGESAPIALGGDSLGAAPLVNGEMDDAAGFLLWPLLAGAAALAGGAYAYHEHNKDDKKHHDKTSPEPTNIKVTDHVGPIQGDLSEGAVTDDNRPAISGDGVPGAVIHIIDNGVEIGSTTVNPDGHWDFVPTTDLSDDGHSIDVTQEVPGEKPSAPVHVIDFVVDTIPPAAPEAHLDPASDSGVKGDDITNDTRPTIDGKTEPGADITVTFPTGEEIHTKADENGDWSVTPTQPLPEGNNDITVIATDPAGNQSEPTVLPIEIDTTPPKAPDAWLDPDSDTGIKGDDITSDTKPTIDGKTEPGADVTVTFPTGEEIHTRADENGDWSVTPTQPLPEGNNDITVTATDPAGNQSEPTVLPIVIDTSGPDPKSTQLTIDVVAGDDIVNQFESTQEQIISGQAKGEFQKGDIVSFTLNGHDYSAAVAADGTWSVKVAGADLAAETNIHATLVAHDAAGNAGNIVADHGYRVDTILPVAQLTIDAVTEDNVLNIEESKVPQTISGKATGEFREGDIVSFKLNGTTYSAAVAANGKWSVEVAGSDLAKATNIHATLIAHDVAGNTASVVADHPYTVAIDPQMPTLSIHVIAGDDVVNLAESQENQAITGGSTGGRAGDIVKVVVNGVTYSGTIDAKGDWSINVPGAGLAADAAHQVVATLTASDAAGNITPVTESRHYDVDTTPPVAQLSIDKVTGDDIVNLDESKVPQIISGKATGEFQKGDIVSFTLNGHDYSAAVAADGKWSVTVAGADLAAATNIHATLVAHDTAGNPTDVVIDHGYQVILTPPQPSVYIDPVAGDGVINLAESQENQAITGGSSGGRAGDVISIVVNDVTYSTTIDANGKWSITVPGSELVADADHHIDASFMATDIAGNTTTVTAGADYDVDLIPPVATLEINRVAGDDIVNASEANTNQTISGKAGGEFLAGDLVTFTLNGTDYSAKVAADGTWSVQVSGTDLAKGTSIDATLVAHDAAGNSTSVPASHPYTVDLLPPVAQLTIDAVTEDNVLNIEESKLPQTISGKATGEFRAGDIVSFKLNGTTYSAAVAANGKWSVEVAGSDLAKATNIHATLIAHDVAGNTASVVADHPYTVAIDPQMPTLSIHVIAGDDVVNLAESQENQAITGGSTGGRAGDIVKVVVNGVTYSGTIDAKGDWSINVPGAGLAADAAHQVVATLTASDAAGNITPVTESRHYDVDTTPAVAQLSIDKVTGDDIVNLDESKVPQIISGKATGEFQKGDIVSFTLNGHDYSAAVAADGKWSVTVAGADLAAATNIHATLVAHDTAGNPTDVVIDHGYQVILTPPQPSVYIDPVAGDGVINLAESQENQAITGGSSGGRAGDVISIVVNDVTYSSTIDANGKWSITVPGSELVADADHHIDASFVATDIAGNTTTVTAGADYDVDLIPPVATLEINRVAGDDIVNASEANTNQTISGKAGGEFLAGDLVTFTLNGTDYSAKVAADGTWSVQVSGTDLANGTSIDATLVAHDAAGNSSTVTANHPYTVDLLPPVAQLTINSVTEDNVLNFEESQQPQVISGQVTGEFCKGDIVSFKLNGTSYSAAVAADGKWNVTVAGADLAEESSLNIHATLIAHDVAGNTASVVVDHPYLYVPIPGHVTLTIDVVAGDDIVNVDESKSPDNTVSGTSTGARTGDVVSLTINGKVYTGAVGADGKSWSVSGIAGSDLVADSDLKVDGKLHATDAAGNSFDAFDSHGYTLSIIPLAATLTIDWVAGDNIVNADEVARADNTVTGTSTGARAGDVVTLTINGKTYTGTVAADGKSWSVTGIAGSDLKADSDHKVDGKLHATDAAGNSFDALDSHEYTVTDTLVASLIIETVAGDNIVNVDESKSSDNTVTGTSSGARAGDVVTLTINGKAYSGTVAADGKSWSVSGIAGSDLVADSDLKVDGKLHATDAAGNSFDATDSHSYTLSIVPLAATLTIDWVAGDNIVNVDESKSPDNTVTGTSSGARAGDVVTLTINGKAYSGTVAADGKSWSVSGIAGSDLVADSDLKVDGKLHATDAAGNSFDATDSHSYTLSIVPLAATLTIDWVAGDNIVNVDESKSPDNTVTGTSSGARAGDVVTLTINGKAYSGTVAADGKSWSVSGIAGSDLVADSDLKVDGKLHATDAAGNSFDAFDSHGYTLSIIPLAATLTIDWVAGDNIVNADEVARADNTVTGTSTGARAGDVVTLTINGKTYTGTVAADGKSWSVTGIAGSDLKADSDHKVDGKLHATDAAGNSFDALDSHEYTVTDTLVASLIIETVAGDNIVNVDESKSSDNTVTGTSSGARAGDVVTLTINGKAYSGTVGADGKSWSVSGIAGSDLVADSDLKVDGKLHATDAAGNSFDATDSHSYTLSIVPLVATLTIDWVAGDNIVNADEVARADNTVTGTSTGARAGDVVTLTINGKTYTGTVAADGKSWSVTGIAGSDLKADSDHKVDGKLHATDAAGNSFDALDSHEYTVTDTLVASLIIETVAGDNIVNVDESKSSDNTVTGTSSGARAGDVVTLTINGKAYSGTVAADGKSWSVSGIAGSDLVADSDLKVDGKLHATDAAGNSFDATDSHSYTLSIVPLVATLTIDWVAGDNIVNADEVARADNTVTGTSTGARAGDVVTLTINGKTYTGAVAADGKSWSVSGIAGSDLVADSDHVVDGKLHATDAAGNYTDATTTHGYEVDLVSTKPTIDSVYDDVGAVTGNIANGGETDDTQPKISGTAEANSTVTIYDNNLAIGSTTADGTGHWEFTPSTDLAFGEHDLTVKAIDKAGNTSVPSDDFKFSVIAGGDDYPDALTGKGGHVSLELLLDVSSVQVSGVPPDYNGFTLAKQAIVNMINAYLDAGAVVDVSLYAMGNKGSSTITSKSDPAYTAFVNKVNGISSGQSTYSFESDLDLVMSHMKTEYASPSFDSNVDKQVFYFGDGGNNTGTATRTAWDNTLTTLSKVAPIDVTAVVFPSEPKDNPIWAGLYSGATPQQWVNWPQGALEAFKNQPSIVSPTTAAQIADVVLKDMVVDSVTGNVLNNDQALHRDGTEHLTQVSLNGQIFKINASGNLEIVNPNSAATATYDKATGLLSIHTAAGQLNIYMTASTGHKAGDYQYNAYAHVGSGEIDQNYDYTAVTNSGNTQSATLHIVIDPAQHTAGLQSTYLGATTEPQDADSLHAAAQTGHDLTLQDHDLTIASAPPTQIHEIQGLSDTFFGAPSESKVVSLWASASDYLASDANQGIHGGNGVDVLKVEGHDQVLDLTSAHGKITGMEVIDLSGDGANTLKLSLQDVLDNGQADLFHSTDKHSVQMMVQGNSDDVVNLDHQSAAGKDGTWSDKGTMAVGEVSYHVYQNSTGDAELLIQQGVQVHLV